MADLRRCDLSASILLKVVITIETIQKCGRCNRILKTEKSKETGYGPVCYGKVFAEGALLLLDDESEKKNDPLQRVIEQAL